MREPKHDRHDKGPRPIAAEQWYRWRVLRREALNCNQKGRLDLKYETSAWELKWFLWTRGVLRDAFSHAKVDRCSALVSCNTAKGAWRAGIPTRPPSDSLAAALVKSHGGCACGHLKQT